MQKYKLKAVNIKSIGYESNTLFIEFINGATFSYYGVPYSEFTNFLNASSPDSYFKNNIKNSYSHIRIC